MLAKHDNKGGKKSQLMCTHTKNFLNTAISLLWLQLL